MLFNDQDVLTALLSVAHVKGVLHCLYAESCCA